MCRTQTFCRAEPLLNILRDVDLSTYNTLALAARADYFCELNSAADALQAVELSRAKGLPLTLLGGGSNVIIAGPLAGLTAHMGIKGREKIAESDDSVEVKFGAGENWHDTVNYCLDQGWYGLENLSLIPGTVGAAPIQNIGAYGVELEAYFVALEALALDSGERVRFNRSDCQFGYRDSIFKGAAKDRYVITSVTLRLAKTPSPILTYPALQKALQAEGINAVPTPRQIADTVCRIRREKLPDPKTIPNAGSFFKNPLIAAAQTEQLRQQFPDLVAYPQSNDQFKLAAGWLIEQAGWKGVQRDGVGVHQHQALVLVSERRHAGATGSALLMLASDIQADIAKKFGVDLEIEPVLLGR